MELYDYQYVGQYLRESRESLRITRDQAALALHIRPKYLDAIETGKLHDLPGKAYSRGYIRNYAEFLGLDATQVLRAYETFLSTDHANFFVPDATLAGHLPSKRVLNWSLIGMLAVYGYWYYNVHDHSKMPAISEETPEQSLDKYRHHVLDTAWKPCPLSEDTSCFLRIREQGMVPKHWIVDYDKPYTPDPPYKP